MGIHHSVLPEVRSDASNWFIGTMLYKNNLESYVKGEGMTRILYFPKECKETRLDINRRVRKAIKEWM